VHRDHREQPRAGAATHEQRLVVERGGVAIEENGAQPGGMLPDAISTVSADAAGRDSPPFSIASLGVACALPLSPVPELGERCGSAAVAMLGSARGVIPSAP
jgi:hypothetical protein